jgi:hypothetical protein
MGMLPNSGSNPHLEKEFVMVRLLASGNLMYVGAFLWVTLLPLAVRAELPQRDDSSNPAATPVNESGQLVAVLSGNEQQAGSQAADAEPVRSTSEKHVTESLKEIIERAREGIVRIQQEVRDYECMLIKLERVDGKLQDRQYMLTKIRHEQRDGDKVTVPFSVYLKFLKPEKLEGREVIYVKGRNNGDLIGRRGGKRNPSFTAQLEPTSPLAMDGNRYPITEIGVVTMIHRLVEVMEEELKSDNCEIKIFEDAKLDGRPCRHFQLTRLKQTPDSEFMMARVFVDEEYRVPIYYAAYDWPKEAGGEPVLLEEYTYRNIKVNVGFTDKDFDPANPKYGFTKVEPVPSDQ